MNEPIRPRKYAHEDDRTHEWWRYALSYVEAAQLLFRQLKDGGENRSDVVTLALPAAYCLRHSIELMLKFLAFGVGESLALTHDPKRLLALIKEPLRSVDREQLEQIAVVFECDVELIQSFLQVSTDRIERLIAKYHSYAFVGAGSIVDDKNEIFRYPVSLSNGQRVDVDRFATNFDVDSALTETEDLRMFLFSVVFMFGKTSSGRSVLEEPPPNSASDCVKTHEHMCRRSTGRRSVRLRCASLSTAAAELRAF